MTWMMLARAIVVAVALAQEVVIFGTDSPPTGHVKLAVSAEKDQPVGAPVVVEVTVTNIGAEPISWWCGGPDIYPGAEHFIVNLRYGGEAEWHVVNPTNGQCIEGSGSSRTLQPGESIAVPLAIPVVSKHDIVSLTVASRTWNGEASPECGVTLRDQRSAVDGRRMRMIEAAISQSPPFWQHVASIYADEVVVDAMLKLIAVDNVPIALGAARVLRQQKSLPAGSSDLLAELVQRWFVVDPYHTFSELQFYLVRVALITQGEAARAAVIKVVIDTTDARTRALVMDGLRLSPGDEGWLRRVRQVIADMTPLDNNVQEFESFKATCLNWLDSRISNPQ